MPVLNPFSVAGANQRWLYVGFNLAWTYAGQHDRSSWYEPLSICRR
jgi:hypothetical protein